MKMLDKSIIENFSEETDNDGALQCISLINNITCDIFNRLKQNNKFACAPFELSVANELDTGCFTINSDIDLLLSINSGALELNTIKYSKISFLKKVSERFKFAWKNRKKIFKSKKQKVNKIVPPKENRYTINGLKSDFYYMLSKYFNNTTTIYNNEYGITILSKDELNYNVNIYFCFYKNEQMLLYANAYNKTLELNFEQRFKNFEIKESETNGNFKKLVRVFNNVFYYIYGYNANQIFIESVVYNIKSSIISNIDIYNAFLLGINYLNTMQTYKNICNDKDINQDKIMSFKSVSVKNLINKIKECI